MKVERMAMSGQMLAPAPDPLEHLGLVGRPLHRLQHLRAGMLEGDVEIGEDQPLGHERDHPVDVRIGIDVMEPHPGAQFAELAGEIGHVGADLAAALQG